MMRRLLSVVAAMVMAVTALASPAVGAEPAEPAAVNPLRNIVTVVKISKPNGGAATAWCPPGKIVLGGGFRTTKDSLKKKTFNTFKPVLGTTSSGAVWGFHAGASVHPTLPATHETFTTVAQCADPLPGWEIVVRQSDLWHWSEMAVSATCPAEKVVIGSGASGAGGSFVLDEVYPSTNAVHVKAFGSTYFPWSITAYAICAFPLLERSVVRDGVGAVRADRTAEGRSRCPFGTVALSAGFDLVNSLGTARFYAAAPEPVVSIWSVFVKAADSPVVTAPRPWSAGAYAVCAAY